MASDDIDVEFSRDYFKYGIACAVNLIDVQVEVVFFTVFFHTQRNCNSVALPTIWDVPTLAIHQRYTNDTRDNVKTAVPKALSDSAFRVLVHQHKLDEGVDIPAAKLMVLTCPLGSARELVQTVGRVVRTFDGLHPVVLEFDHPTNFAMWSSYRDFDSSLQSVNGVSKFLASLNTGRLFELYLDAFPEFSYR
ncbi:MULTISPECIES: helicase-related protein [unclassified Janthinobacterium]|uniref:helicase-related protein n=1 Tax=unclassified Janthinobacterium TaxID=2610881 RepID=UPI001E40078A|nr:MULTISPECIES: helicase-related protein [unclassified Janthinobacterium]MCC7643323.1 hypothetical protein [Janthinobacterium sp. EB271-G4-3-1]MCC7693792.1 hypothetical protein [Janthinobacterium sp. EB271-G4-3-2]